MLYPNGTKTEPHVSSGFGPRKVTIPGASSYHQGVDFTGFRDVKAVLGGKVTHAGTLGGFGNAVAIDVEVTRDLIVTHVYGHLANGSIAVRVGQTVAEGTQLGVMGDTGTAGGINLHFEVRHWRGKNLTRIDPLPYLRAGVAAASAAPAPAASKPSTPAYPVISVDNITAGLSREQIIGLQWVARAGGYKGAPDAIFGPGSKAGLAAFCRNQYGSIGNWLRRRWGYPDADDLKGPNMNAAIVRAANANYAAARPRGWVR